MSYSVEQIATALGAQAFGAVDLLVSGVAEPQEAGPEQLALAMTPAYGARLAEGQARAAMLWPGADWQALGLEAALIAPRPRYAMSGLSAMMDTAWSGTEGQHPSAVVHPSAEIGAGAQIGALVVIEEGVKIGRDARIEAHVSIARNAILGEDAVLRAGVRIGHNVVIGDRFVAQPGAVVGGDGFSFVTPEESTIERARDSLGDQGEITQQSYARIHSLGSVRVGHDVELGANACIDRGTVRDTVVGDGCKFDNLSQIGHNVVLGRDCLICAQVGVAGSSVIGNNVVLGGQSGVSDNLTIGDNVITGGATKVLANVPAGRVMLGYPATKMENQLESYKALRRLPRLMRDVAALKKAVSNSGESD